MLILLFCIHVYHRRVFVMIDSRRGMQNVDLEMMHTLNQSYIPYQVQYPCYDA